GRVTSTDPQYAARLHKVGRIDAGGTTHAVIASEDGLCYPVRTDVREPDRSWPCRLLHVLGGKTGVLSISVVPDDPRDRFGVSFAVGSEPTLLFATPCCPWTTPLASRKGRTHSFRWSPSISTRQARLAIAAD